MKKNAPKQIIGLFQATSRGFGFVTPEGGVRKVDDYFIPPRYTGGAWDGDKVAIVPEPPDGEGGNRSSARIVAVLERANKTVTGAVRKLGREQFLAPDSDRIPGPIQILGKNHGVHVGDKVAVAVTSYGTAKNGPMGTLRERFGREGSREASTAAILYQNDIDEAFPPAVLLAADKAPQAVEPQALAGRSDFRDKTILTIDGASAKDLDDAVSLERDSQGLWVLGVHIADVSHYVTEKSLLDLEAFERGTSVYFADRVIPMLPPALSNGICSLNPQVDRLALTCEMTMTEAGAVVAHRITKSVIRTTERMTYDDCNALLAGTDPALAARYAPILPMLREMAALAKALEKTRRLRGSLDLDTSESYIVCDEQGVPIDIRARKQGESEALIESFMLIANETVAKHLFDRQKPAVYRVHEKPSADKKGSLRAMLAPFGYDVKEGDHFTLQKILDASRDKPEAPIVSIMILRSLMKARYDTENLGHFGLAAEFYCHFTSPIRRYPDLMIHRILEKVIADEAQEKEGPAPWEKAMAVVAKKAAVQASQRELAAQSAEREIEKCYMAEFMKHHVGEELSGAVSGVTKFNLFVMLQNGVEGILPVEALPHDRYRYDEARMSLTGENAGRAFSFGMPLTVQCISADPGTGEVQLRLAGAGEAPYVATDAAVTRPSLGREKPLERHKKHQGNRPLARGSTRKKGMH